MLAKIFQTLVGFSMIPFTRVLICLFIVLLDGLDNTKRTSSKLQ